MAHFQCTSLERYFFTNKSVLYLTMNLNFFAIFLKDHLISMKYCMSRVKFYSYWQMVPEQKQLMVPLKNILQLTPPLRSRCNKPLAMNTEKLLNILTYYRLQGFPSGRLLLAPGF